MGFRCPVCMKDFCRDKEKWEEHIKNEHDGIGKDIVNLLEKSCGDTRKGKKGKWK